MINKKVNLNQRSWGFTKLRRCYQQSSWRFTFKETGDWLEFGKIVQGNFKALCIRRYEVDNGFEVFTFMPMVVYDARRIGQTIQVEVPKEAIQYQIFAVFCLIDRKNSKLKKFGDYFRML